MKRFMISWTLPFIIASILVFFIRFFFIHLEPVSDNGMSNTLTIEDKTVCLNSNRIDIDDIVLVRLEKESDIKFRRVVALPSDTILIKHSIVYINRKRFDKNTEISFEYAFSSDSIAYASKLLNDNGLMFNPKLATIGVFQFIAGLEGLKKVKADSMHFNVKRIIEDPLVSENENMFFHSSLYWNKDNMGPLIVPGKGKKVHMNEKNYYLYKQIIENESMKKLELTDNHFYLDKKTIDNYTFKQNYYFVLSDNRHDPNDSRAFGFISENQITCTFWLKFPW